MSFTFSVPTKTEDNCSYAYASKRDDVDETFDAFSYYSSDLIRLKTLLLSDDDSSNDDDDDLSAMTAVNNALRSAGLNTLSGNNNQVNDDASSKRRRGNNSLPIEQQQHNSSVRLGFRGSSTQVCFYTNSMIGPEMMFKSFRMTRVKNRRTSKKFKQSKRSFRKEAAAAVSICIGP